MSSQYSCPWPHGGIHPVYGLLTLLGSTSNPNVIRQLGLIDPHMAAYFWQQRSKRYLAPCSY